LTSDLELLKLHDQQQHQRLIRYFGQDESRFGLKTLIGRVLTACGVKPIGTWQWLFSGCAPAFVPRPWKRPKSRRGSLGVRLGQDSAPSKAFWLDGAVEPTTGASFFRQFSHVDTDCFQRFLDEFSQAYPDSLKIIQLDNGRFHTSKKLVVPDNIILLFQPPYCPELNPIEHLWQYLTAHRRWAAFKTLEELQIKVGQLLAQLTPQIIANITGYPFSLDALSVINTI
jgi:DDE superfamily endonuclease